MAENEYLDSTKARRWYSVVQAIRHGGSVEDVADRVEECFFKTLRQIRKVLPFGEMIRAMEDPDELMRLAFVTRAKLNGCQWANLIDLPPKAA